MRFPRECWWGMACFVRVLGVAQAPGSGHLDEAWVRGVSGWGGTAWLGREPQVRVALAPWPQLSGSQVKPAFLSLQDLCPNQTTGFLRASHRVTLPGATPQRKWAGSPGWWGGMCRAGPPPHTQRGLDKIEAARGMGSGLSRRLPAQGRELLGRSTVVAGAGGRPGQGGVHVTSAILGPLP